MGGKGGHCDRRWLTEQVVSESGHVSGIRLRPRRQGITYFFSAGNPKTAAEARQALEYRGSRAERLPATPLTRARTVSIESSVRTRRLEFC